MTNCQLIQLHSDNGSDDSLALAVATFKQEIQLNSNLVAMATTVNDMSEPILISHTNEPLRLHYLILHTSPSETYHRCRCQLPFGDAPQTKFINK